MEMNISMTISIVSLFIAFGAFITSWLRANAAIKQANTASESLHRMSVRSLFTSFNLASHICVDKPDVLYAVDGLDKSIPAEEAKNIAYFGLLMDGFQQFYGQIFKENYSQMAKELKRKSTYLSRLLASEANQKRWNILKPLYYGDFDSSFIEAIDELIQYENENRS